MASSIELSGTDSLLKAIRKQSEAAAKRIEKTALRTAGEVVAQGMRQRAPRSNFNRQYHLQDNISVSNVMTKDGIKYVKVGPNKYVSWRAHFPEFGTSNQPAEPYIEPGFRATKDQALNVLAEELRKGLRA